LVIGRHKIDRRESLKRAMANRFRIGLDIGGTFTDIVFLGED